MKANFQLHKQNPHTLQIEYLDEYDSKMNIDLNSYPYSNVMTIDVILTVSSTEEETEYFVLYTNHSTNEFADSKILNIDITKDNLFKITHILLPVTNEAGLDYYISLSKNTTNIYFVCIDDQIIKIENGEVEIIDLSLLIEYTNINPNCDLYSNLVLKFSTQYTMLLFYLYECYFKIASDLLKKLCPSHACLNYSELSLKRDIIWMAINIIKYLIHLGKYFEALKYLEIIQSCGGICSNYVKEKGGNCGCHARNDGKSY